MHVEMEALVALTTEKGMSLEQLIQAIEAGVLTAYNETAEPNRYAQAKLNRETGEIQIIIPEFNEMGERIAEKVDEPEGFGRTITSTARQVIKQAMRATNDAEIVGEFTTSVGDVISGVIQQGRDPKMINVNSKSDICIGIRGNTSCDNFTIGLGDLEQASDILCEVAWQRQRTINAR